MHIFLKEYFFTLWMFFGYGLVGGFSLVPFRNGIKYPMLAAPMAGMLLLAMGVFILYCLVGLSVLSAVAIVGINCIIFTMGSILYIKPKLRLFDTFFVLSIVMILAAILTYITNFTSIQFGQVGFLFRDGSDHLGYAMMADWLNNHTIRQLPIENPSFPYQSFPALLTKVDPRFGSFFTLAIISLFSGQTSTFAFDNACGLVLLIGFLGVASLYSRSFKTLVLITLALLVGSWYDLSRMGFFGKTMGFPAALYILGLFFVQQNKNFVARSKVFALILTLILTLSAAMVYPGYVLALFLISVGGLFTLLTFFSGCLTLNSEQFWHALESIFFLMAMILIALASAGLLTYPSHLSVPVYNPLKWLDILLHQFDIRAFVRDVILVWYNDHVATLFLYLTIFMLLVSFSITLLKRNRIACTLIGASIILFVLPFLIGSKWIAFQFAGTLYALWICGMVWYLDESIYKGPDKLTTVLTTLFVLTAIAIRIPSNIEIAHRYIGDNVWHFMQYSKHDLDQVATVLNQNPVIIDIPSVMFALPLLAEFGPRDMKLQWSEASWKAIVGYRDWKSPKISPARFVIGLNSEALKIMGLEAVSPDRCQIIAKTNQYRLFSCFDWITSQPPLTYKQKS